MSRVCLSNHAVGTPVFVYHSGPPVRRQICNMHRKLLVMFVAFFGPCALLPPASNDAKYHAKVRSIPRNLPVRRSYIALCEKERPVCTSQSPRIV